MKGLSNGAPLLPGAPPPRGGCGGILYGRDSTIVYCTLLYFTAYSTLLCSMLLFKCVFICVCVCVCFQVCVWLKERRAVALDESWRDWTNLQSKLLKHQSFQADILANQNRVDALIQVYNHNFINKHNTNKRLHNQNRVDALIQVYKHNFI